MRASSLQEGNEISSFDHYEVKTTQLNTLIKEKQLNSSTHQLTQHTQHTHQGKTKKLQEIKR